MKFENSRDVSNNLLQVQELLKDVESYQRDVQDVLRPGDVMPSARLKQLVDRSIEIDIDIAELKSLKWVNHIFHSINCRGYIIHVCIVVDFIRVERCSF